jgi:sarcosine oxidase, subunit gamma
MDEADDRSRDAPAALVSVGPIELPALQTLRLFRPSDEEFGAVSARLGFELPLEANRLTRASPSAARLAPGEWLVRQSSAADIATRLEGLLHHVCEIGAGRAGWRIVGPAAADLIACGCSLDLHPTVFSSGMCTRTLLAQIGVTVSRPYDNDGFEIIADRSHGPYLAAWLDDAALAFAP